MSGSNGCENVTLPLFLFTCFSSLISSYNASTVWLGERLVEEGRVEISYGVPYGAETSV